MEVNFFFLYKLIFWKKLGLKNLNNLPDVNDKDSWTKMKKIFSEIFIQKTRDEWCKIFDFTDACVGKKQVNKKILLIIL